jgi:hypothetical protein
MPFCPNCRYEYLPEVTKCPDCDAYLVPELPDIHVDSEDIKWVALTPLSGVVYAKMVCEVLEQRGIPNYTQSLFGSGGLGQIMTAGTVGAQAKIYVPEEQQQEAQNIQDDMLKDA